MQNLYMIIAVISVVIDLILKLYSKPKNKSWSIKMEERENGDIMVVAVDSTTGENIATIIIFDISGDIMSCIHARRILDGFGYGPYEHGNKYNDDGSIVIK